MRPASILKNLKNGLDPASVAEIQSRDIESEMVQCHPLLTPSAVYDTWSRNETPEPLKPVWTPELQSAISISLIAATVGNEIQRQIRWCKEHSETTRAVFLTAVAQEALEQSFHFVHRLISEEAKQDGCELSPFLPVTQELTGSALTVLDSQKADIVFEEGQIRPLYSAVRYCLWNPMNKKNARSR